MMKHEDASEELRAVAMRAELARRISSHAPVEGRQTTEIPALSLSRRSAPSACMSAAYEPSLVVFVQGHKRINLGKASYLCDGSNFLLTSVDLPVVSQVVTASEDKPLLGMLLGLVIASAREMKDTSLKNLKDVRAYTQMAILGSIPLLENDFVVRRRRRLAWLGWTTACLAAATN